MESSVSALIAPGVDDRRLQCNVVSLGTLLPHNLRGMARVAVDPGGLASGLQDGMGTDAEFYLPKGIAVDVVGNVYVGDTKNHQIRKITPEGEVTTVGEVTFSRPFGVAVDSAVYVADTGNNKIRKLVSPKTEEVWLAVASNGMNVFASVGTNSNPVRFARNPSGELSIGGRSFNGVTGCLEESCFSGGTCEPSQLVEKYKEVECRSAT